MATRRRVGVSSASTEAARRALMQPVPCWEKAWVVPETAPAGSTLRILKWVKTSKTQHFSDDEGEADEPLAPLPDDGDVGDGDDDEQDDTVDTAAPTQPHTAEASVAPEEEPPSKPASPKPLLSMAQGLDDSEMANDVLDESLKTMQHNMEAGVGVGLDEDDGMMDISSLAPDGLGLEGAHDLSQIDGGDALLGGPLQMDESEDPFGVP
ncbi:hypothetical protein FB45DRAFT_789181 [Roridomyces roridus]|uniref:Uncharacterized protein n=1 Tax=Roridomyces roridus TaxID=1738132 RepID=A0AAD7C2A4_9AGAR|nr:hypothetical protein FB45DRAFT_789181 [Roridomyces roridus]